MNVKTKKMLHKVNAILGQARSCKMPLAVLLAAVALFTLLPMVAFAADGDTGTTDGFEWRENSGMATITGYTGTDSVINIPGTVANNDGTDLPVVSIGSNAFDGKNITAVTIPESVQYIGMRAFYECTGLTAITIPAAVQYIDEQAFDRCTSITSITFGPGSQLYFINGGAFSDTAITSISIPAGVETIREGAFMGCSKLTSINIPNGVTIIEDETFSGCSELTSITIPSEVTKIDQYAFDGCSALTSITIPTKVSTIGRNAFRGCATLTSITIPSGVTIIEDETFSGCTNLATVNFAADISLSSIGGSAFQGCTALSSITIPVNVSTIGGSAFKGCTNLVTVNLNDSLSSIGDNAFQGCTALTSINITAITIGSSAFEGCTALTSVNFVSQYVNSIGNGAFQGCTSLVKVTLKSKNAAFGNSVFNDTALGSDGVYGYKNSTADTYCKANSIPFHFLTDGEVIITTTSLPNGTIYEPYNQTLARIGHAVSVIWSIMSGSLPNGLSLNADGVISGTPTALGSSTFTVKVVNNSDAADSDTQELTITIGKKTPTAAELIYDLTPKTYNGFAQPLTVTGAAGLGAITVKYDGNETAPTNAGTYAVTVDITEGTDFGSATGVSLGNYIISKAELTITGGSVAAKTYDGTTTAEVTSLTFSGLLNSETLTITTDYTISNAHFNSADAGNDKTVTGTAALVSTGTTAKNYTLTNPSLFLTGQTISKANFTVPNVNKLIAYTDTGSQTVDIAALVADKKLSGDILTYQAGNATGPNADIIQSKSVNAAGTLTFTVSGGTTGSTATIPVTVAGFTNYNDVTVNVVVTLTDKIQVTVTLPAPDKTYDGNPAAASATANGIPSEDFVYTWLDSNGIQLANNTPPRNAGSYQVKAEISGNSANIYIGEATVSFTIAKKTVTVSADDKSVTQGGVLPAPTVSYSGFVGTDSAANALEVQAEARLNVTDSSAVGTSVIDFETQAVLNNTIGANYTLSHVNGTLTIVSGSSPSGGSGGGGSSGSGNASSTGRLEIPSSFVSNPNSGKTLTLGNEFASVTIPSDILENIPGIVSKKVEISVGQGDKSGLTDDVKAAIGDRPLISLSLLIDGKQTDWSNPDAPVTVSIPYSPTAGELANPEGITVYYIDGNGNMIEISGAKYDPKTKAVVFQTTHFSYFAVGYKTATAPTVQFSDVLPGAWYYDAVSFCAAKGITTGTGNGKFSPDATLTRGQFITMLLKAYGIEPIAAPADNFSDAGSTYYTGYLAAAKARGVSNGVGDNKFAPEKAITRQEMFTLLYNALKALSKLPTTDNGKILEGFTDSGNVASWAIEPMTALVKSGTVYGNDGKLDPTGGLTRAQMAQVLYNLLGK